MTGSLGEKVKIWKKRGTGTWGLDEKWFVGVWRGLGVRFLSLEGEESINLFHEINLKFGGFLVYYTPLRVES